MAYADDANSSYELFQRPIGAGANRAPRLDSGGTGMTGTDPMSSLYNFGSDPSGILALLGTGLGIGSNIYSGIQGAQDQQKVINQAEHPFDVNQYLPQITQGQQDAMTRALKAQLALRGVPSDSMATSGAVSEMMGQDYLQRYNMALQPAMAQQQNLLAALGGRKPPPAMGDTSSLGNYFNMLKLMTSQNQAQQQQQGQTASFMEWLKGLYGGGNQQPSQISDQSNFTPEVATQGNFQGDTGGGFTASDTPSF